jgi:hypothetical protein
VTELRHPGGMAGAEVVSADHAHPQSHRGIFSQSRW